MDDAVVKATDENLTSENWEYILDVCDRVAATPTGPQQTIASLIKRLAHRNANVQLYTLELANALSQNCGAALHRELASKAFTDALLRLAADRNTHAQVKQKVMERMSGWTDEFRSSPELGIMEQAYQKLKMQQPGLIAPSKPVKKEISSDDRRKEEEELQMALKLSIQDKGSAATATEPTSSGASQALAQAQSGQPQGTTAATVSRVRALYDFTPSEPGELAFKRNDIIAVLESVYKDWWKGSLRGQTGIFPLNYVEKLQDPTKEELERDAQMEAEVFGEIKNVEKLLALLSVGSEAGGRRGEREEEEVSELYQRTLSIRPKLIELIARYSQKKGQEHLQIICWPYANLSQTTSLNSMRSSSRPDETTKRCWSHRCPSLSTSSSIRYGKDSRLTRLSTNSLRTVDHNSHPRAMVKGLRRQAAILHSNKRSPSKANNTCLLTNKILSDTILQLPRSSRLHSKVSQAHTRKLAVLHQVFDICLLLVRIEWSNLQQLSLQMHLRHSTSYPAVSLAHLQATFDGSQVRAYPLLMEVSAIHTVQDSSSKDKFVRTAYTR